MTPDPLFQAFLIDNKLVTPGDTPVWSPLSGGVSCETWKVDLRDKKLVVKRALPRLKVKKKWVAPISRNAVEWAWLSAASHIDPKLVPPLVAHDSSKHMFALEYLDPASYPCWRDQLAEGVIDPATGTAVGAALAKLHGATTDKSFASRFDTGEFFYALRLEPFFIATAQEHPPLAITLLCLAAQVASTRLTLIQGDISPKNILVGPTGPVFIDAECATFGDPAFDVAFCIALILLECIPQPTTVARRIELAQAMTSAYLQAVTWENPSELEVRAALLTAVIMLARIDGKSPVNYIKAPSSRQLVRAVTTELIRKPPARMAELYAAWSNALHS